MSFKIRTSGPLQLQITTNTARIELLNDVTDGHTSAIAVGEQPFLLGDNYNPNLLGGNTNALDNIHSILAALTAFTGIPLPNGVPPIIAGRTITFNNITASTNIDLYLTVGGTNPQPIAQLTTINVGGPAYVWPISDTIYNWNGNFTVMPTGVPPPQYNAGPTIAEFGFNQVWSGATP